MVPLIMTRIWLRSKYPLIDDVRFRRILGMSEIISSWNWPDEATTQAVSATLSDRMQRLIVEISDLESEAQAYASSAEVLAKLTREAKIAEATYRVLIEQVKSQSLAAGFQSDTFTVFEYATPPLQPSAPRTNLLVIFGATLGFLIGITPSMINSMRKGVFYTRNP